MRPRVTRFKDSIVYMYAGVFRYLYEAEGIIHVASIFLLLCTRAYYEVYLFYLWVFLNH